MATPWLTKYIPVGCLKVSMEELDGSVLALLEPAQEPSQLQDWKFFARPQDNIPAPMCLPKDVQECLLNLPILRPFFHSWHNRWLQLSFAHILNSKVAGGIRIYILPQDVDRSIVNPHHFYTKLISTLLSQLDYSASCWNGAVGIDNQGPEEASAKDEDASLLSMFNNVPSPDPHPELEPNLDTRDRMECLLESQIPGLTTKLYPYQGRSAALMLQREENPGRIVDPRYQLRRDQEGRHWYFDDVAGSILRDARYYDGARGGILAEEMGTGKTLICLALILCTKNEPAKVPEPFLAEVSPRLGKTSLLDMVAAATNKHSVPWKPYFEACSAQLGYDYRNCIDALTRPENRAFYKVQNTLVEPRRSSRNTSRTIPSKTVYLSSATLVVVPNNLVKQWQTEISKHTTGLNVLTLVSRDPIPPVTVLLTYDLILFSEGRFEFIQREKLNGNGPTSDVYCPLEHILFKRCIIDEGHKLGNRGRAWRSDMMRVLDGLEISARWVVTGTPSRGLYGVDQEPSSTETVPRKESTALQEKDDLQRIGNITAKYLKVRPWANTRDEAGDSVADWNTYVMDSIQHYQGHNRKDCLRNALNSLITRHQLPDVKKLLPPVEEKIVMLDGSFQDKLSLNLFSMMIIFNSVQSQRTDMDYFFHERQRKSLIQLVKNLKQACFFGGVFYSVEDIATSLETAEEFFKKKAIPISDEDEDLLKQGIAFGKIALGNRLKHISNKYHAMPLYLDNFPGGCGKNWSLDDEANDGNLICTDAGMIHALQKYLGPCIDAPESLRIMIETGRVDQQGAAERSQALMAVTEAAGPSVTQPAQTSLLAGNTPLGDDHHSKPKSGNLEKAILSVAEEGQEAQEMDVDHESQITVAEPLAMTKIISTVSVKLSYLIDSIVKYQDEEQIIVFYDNENVAWYLAGVLEILQIKHLIYSRAGLNAERRAKYVATFTHNPKFRVLLMDISQAAFGLDMRSASRIYFLSPVLNPQVEAQAIGRARRISQQKPVSVETLVLRDSIEEVMIQRKKQMTHAEHTKVKSILDDRLMYQWILNAKIIPMPDEEDSVAQTAMLQNPQFIFGRGFGREVHPDEGLVSGSPESKAKPTENASADGSSRLPLRLTRGLKRHHSPSPTPSSSGGATNGANSKEKPPKRRARVTFAE
ncbi:P-loop containing nucleoside triphosphate hydrolase protein [Hypomontagnella monticulosa]|nr:P-loop containing nucleoside triphosphate hydrolase protein [Hypomontagnella monticulosa]